MAIVTLHVVSNILATSIEREVTHLVANLCKEHRIDGREVRILLSLYEITIELGRRTGPLSCAVASNTQRPTAYWMLIRPL